jgi:hypothetical protein
MTTMMLEIGLALGLGLLLWIAWVIGSRLGRKCAETTCQHPQFGMVQGAILGLMSLLLGFCFSGAMSRFIERQDILANEANAISSAALAARLLPDEHRVRLEQTLREYADVRLTLFAAQRAREEEPIQRRLEALQDTMWKQASDGVAAHPQLAAVVLKPISETIDLLSVRNAADQRHMPLLIFIILLACSLASVASIGFGVEGRDKLLRLPAGVLVFLIAASLWTTLDLDFPRVGFVRVDDQPLREVIAWMRPPS